MTDKPHSTLKAIAITSNLAALHIILTSAAERSAEAHRHALQGEQNGAIGAILDLNCVLNEAEALYNAIVALHRTAGF